MYFIRSANQLKGKTISYVNLRNYDETMIIVTEDKGVFVFDKDYDGEVAIQSPCVAKLEICEDEEIREDLQSLGVITTKDIEEYEEIQRKKRKEREEKQEKLRKECRYKQYLELKKEFESNS